MSNNTVDELETSFQNVFSSLTSQEHFNVNDTEEVKTGVEQCIQKFLDTARQTETWFLQRRLLLSIYKPEQIVKEEIQDLKLELMRKEQLLAKHHERLGQWQAMLRAQPPPNMQPQPQVAHAQQQLQAQQHLHLQHLQQQQQQQQQQRHLSPQGARPPMMGQQMPGQMTPHSQQMPIPHPQPTPTQYMPPGPLAYLEQTTSNIGMTENRR